MGASTLEGLQDHLKLAREYALEGLYDTSVIFFDGAIAQINKYMSQFQNFTFCPFLFVCMFQHSVASVRILKLKKWFDLDLHILFEFGVSICKFWLCLSLYVEKCSELRFEFDRFFNLLVLKCGEIRDENHRQNLADVFIYIFLEGMGWFSLSYGFIH